jgi:hypothetical protein
VAKTANLILPEQLDVEVNRFFVDRHFRKEGPDPEEGEGVAGVQRRLVLHNKTVIKGIGSNHNLGIMGRVLRHCATAASIKQANLHWVIF